MFDKAILENGGTLESVPDCHKNHQMCEKAIDDYHHALRFASNCYIIQKCVTKLPILIILQYSLFLIAIRLDKCVIKQLINVSLHFFFVSDQYKTQEMCKRAIYEDFSIQVYCSHKYKFKCMMKQFMNV